MQKEGQKELFKKATSLFNLDKLEFIAPIVKKRQHVRFLTCHCTEWTDFIEAQYYALNKYIVDDFSLYIVNDGADVCEENYIKIKDKCEELNITCLVTFSPPKMVIGTDSDSYVKSPLSARLR